MVEQAVIFAVKILDVQKHLMRGLVAPVLAVTADAHLLQKQHRHKQGIQPELLLVEDDTVAVTDAGGHMLEAAVCRFG